MKSVHDVFRAWPLLLLFLSIITAPDSVLAQESQAVIPERDVLIAVAREIMESARYCALITVDHAGHPQARAMDPFPPEEDMVIWLATNPKTRKVKEIRNDPRVTLHYLDPEGAGYVTITGIARLVEDPNEKARRWKDGWEAFFQDRQENCLLISVTPKRMDVLSYKHDVTGDRETWRTPSVDFEAGKTEE